MAPIAGLLDDYLPRKNFAEELGIREETLIRWEKDGRGPPVSRFGRKVFYFKPSIEQWKRSQERAPRAA
jgi:predicted site-specific integrase-resolvase